MDVKLLYDNQAYASEDLEAAGDSLWLSLKDLKDATGWELKPEGVCRDTACIPVPQDRIDVLLRGQSPDLQFNLTEFARLIEQPFAHDELGTTWYFGPPSWDWNNRLENAKAPDFDLPDFHGNTHSLNHYLGKKVFLLCWASWCSCRFDLPVWSALRDELKDQNFEIITVACETRGSEAALPWVEAAQASHPQLLDVHHLVPELYSTRNVPAAFWIDEQGFIVRANDPIYAQRRTFENGAITGVVTNGRYLDAVREWVSRGPEAHYVKADNDLKDGLGTETWENVQATAYFRLGVLLQEEGRKDEAVAQFKKAHELSPENWNFKRQAWNLGDIVENYGYENIMAAIREPGAPQFYRKVALAETPI